MADCNPVATPMNSNAKLSAADRPQTDDVRLEMQVTPYREAVGSIMYLAIATRPDIAYAVLKYVLYHAYYHSYVLHFAVTVFSSSFCTSFVFSACL